MSIQSQRLLALLDYVQQSARMRTKLVPNVVDHGRFLLFEHQLASVDGVKLNGSGHDDEDEVWLSVPRPRGPQLPPVPDSPWLAPWLNVGVALLVAPKLADWVEGAALIAAGTHRDASCVPLTLAEAADPAIAPDQRVNLTDYGFRAELESQFASYLAAHWEPWAEAEQRRRRLARLYVQLFTLQQELSGSITESQVELVWGVGLGVWRHDGEVVAYPLITRAVDLSIDAATGAAQVRPRDVDPRLELEFYAAADRPGVAKAEQRAREYLAQAPTTLSPFDAQSYEPLLEIVKTSMDSAGEFEPGSILFGDLGGATGEDQLKVSRSWVLFARPRSTSVLVQDLEKFARALRERAEAPLPAAVAALVTAPAEENAPAALPAFRGLSAGVPDGQDLYFPKPFNDEQVRVVQLLETHDGVVVQGPPGTGKTHTIANIVCHWLANGRRVLVTSMKEPALAVLREHLPEAIRPLAISLLASEHEGMREFEQSIERIAAGVQSIDPSVAAREIVRLEETADALHTRIARVDTDLSRWARLNLSRIELERESIEPVDAAAEVLQHAAGATVIPDALGVGPQYALDLTAEDCERLRQARLALGPDIDYVEHGLPALAAFPDDETVLRAHHDLLRFGRLVEAGRTAELPPLPDDNGRAMGAIAALTAQIEQVRALRDEIDQGDGAWTAALRERLRHGAADQTLALLEALGQELETAANARRAYLARPVSVPPPVEHGTRFVHAVDKLAQGKRAFGFGKLFSRGEARRGLDEVRVSGQLATGAGDWQHVAGYLALQKKWRELAARWNALAADLGLQRVAADDPGGGLAAYTQFLRYQRIKALVAAEAALAEHARALFPAWPPAYRVADDATALGELERAIAQHVATHRLSEVWAMKAAMGNALEGATGRLAAELRAFFADTVGNPGIDEASLLARWSALRAELGRLQSLAPALATVREITGRIAAAGAPRYAQRLQQPVTTHDDALLPADLEAVWRLRRLASHLEAIDSQAEFKKLSRLRTELEHDLARTYHDLVVARSWLKLTEQATPRVRAALQAYLNAIQKIGKGTGKRAVRYRQDARNAAADAYHAIPCWIMPHYRVSESLPAELGCFDLVIVDEASQSDLSALPALLRAKRLLIVGDDRQVSPESVGVDEERVKSLMQRFLDDQVPLYRAQMSPERSIYDLARVVFARSSVMLKEHFRCVAPIIEYSKREFYQHELKPLRLPKPSERLEPSLIDVFIDGAQRKADVNVAEADYIIAEILRITCDPRLARRSIGVVSLLGEEQALRIWDRLAEALGPQALQQHALACGDARTFQGKERDIMFLSMVVAPNEVGAPLSRDIFAQRFNVAASRARDRMYLVRSVAPEHLSESDRLRRGLIAHFSRPFESEEVPIRDSRALCESPVERELYDWLVAQGYRVTPKVRVGGYRIGLVVEGANDGRLAVECDGDKYHGAQNWAGEARRQRVLERVGWRFWRCFAATFVLRRAAVLADLESTLAALNIVPNGPTIAPWSTSVELRRITAGDAASRPAFPRVHGDGDLLQSAAG